MLNLARRTQARKWVAETVTNKPNKRSNYYSHQLHALKYFMPQSGMVIYAIGVKPRLSTVLNLVNILTTLYSSVNIHISICVVNTHIYRRLFNALYNLCGSYSL